MRHRRGALIAHEIQSLAFSVGVELKDMVNLAFHECFERRDYLPTETM
jgi:hypothetical protein